MNEQDATAYIVSTNIKRRNITKGQSVMAVAMMYPEPEKEGKGKRSRIHEGLTDNRRTAQNLLSHARTVLRHAPDKTALVLAGTEKLDAAYKAVQDIERATQI